MHGSLGEDECLEGPDRPVRDHDHPVIVLDDHPLPRLLSGGVVHEKNPAGISSICGLLVVLGCDDRRDR